MPLKHNAETVYLLVLGLLIAISGFIASLLPPLPAGLPYWVLALVISLLYPLALLKMFRDNRVDYEFRMLHWFPAGIFVLWMILELTAPLLRAIYILQLGFLFLWSLPLVALGIFFIILFAAHVLRKRTFRIAVLSLLLLVFCIGAVSAEAMNWNGKLQAAVFPEKTEVFVKNIGNQFRAFKKWIADLRAPSTGTGAIAQVSSSRSAMQSSVRSSVQQSRRPTPEPPVIASSRPTKLPKSGPGELAAVLGAFLLAGYSAILHRRSAARV